MVMNESTTCRSGRDRDRTVVSLLGASSACELSGLAPNAALVGQREHVLPHRNIGQDSIDQMRGDIGHALAAATRADASAVATERDGDWPGQARGRPGQGMPEPTRRKDTKGREARGLR